MCRHSLCKRLLFEIQRLTWCDMSEENTAVFIKLTIPAMPATVYSISLALLNSVRADFCLRAYLSLLIRIA